MNVDGSSKKNSDAFSLFYPIVTFCLTVSVGKTYIFERINPGKRKHIPGGEGKMDKGMHVMTKTASAYPMRIPDKEPITPKTLKSQRTTTIITTAFSIDLMVDCIGM
jgi:hypothetical protein